MVSQFLENLFHRKPKVYERLHQLELEFEKLKAEVACQHLHSEISKLQHLIDDLSKQRSPEPVHIDKVVIEQIYVERYETTNNIGSLGIKELSGRLNIGANYGQAGPASSPFKKENPFKGSEMQKKQDVTEAGNRSTAPRITIKTR